MILYGKYITNETNIKIKVNSFFLAVVLVVQVMVSAVLIKFNIDIPIVYICLGILSVIINHYNFDKKIIPIILLFSFLFFISFLLLRDEMFKNDYLLGFFCFGLVPMYIASVKININEVMKYILIISCLFLWWPISLDSGSIDPGEQMSLSYSWVVLAICGIYFFFTEKKIHLRLLGLCSSIVYTYHIMLFRTRGAVLSIIIFIVLYFLLKIKTRKFKLLYLLLICLFLFLFFSNMYTVFLYLDYILSMYNINSQFIDYQLLLMKRDDMFSGRDLIYEATLNDFLNSPLYGNGVGYYYVLSGSYAHNLFLQLLSEGGLIISIPVFFVMGFAMAYVFVGKSIDHQFKKFFLYLFSISIPKLMFSWTLWLEQKFWVFLFFCFVLTIGQIGKLGGAIITRITRRDL
ncbi:hypothetical protein GT3570_16160 [Geobacillus thermoleovorans]|uniref:O-antigen ligase family protein n=1 Tax=Geobacillus thermoleovorans TaxID=33941 RepID=UPI00078E0EFA|nr:hypothetical protein GT3570_16160 [Geobacillus thermoleovorans]